MQKSLEFEEKFNGHGPTLNLLVEGTENLAQHFSPISVFTYDCFHGKSLLI